MFADCDLTTSPAGTPARDLRGAVRLWAVDLDAFLAQAPRWAEQLGHDERVRATRLGAGRAQARFIVRRTLLRDLLHRSHATLPEGAGLPIADDAAGAAGGVHYAVAQCGDLALIAVAARPVGLALVRVEAVDAALLPDVLAPSEIALLAELPAPRAAVAAALLLASKQAYCQARHASVTPEALVVTLADGGLPCLRAGIAGDDPAEWTLLPVPTASGHVAVLAVPGGEDWHLHQDRVDAMTGWV